MVESSGFAWIIDLIKSYQSVRRVAAETVQLYRFEKFESGMIFIRIEDGSGNIVAVDKREGLGIPNREFAIWSIRDEGKRVLILPVDGMEVLG